MADCFECGEQVSMPFTCSLCSNKFCSKHRLPESHSCPNIGVYQTKEYKKAKIDQQKRIRQTHMSFEDSETAMETRYGNLQFYTTGSHRNDALLGGFLLSLSAILRSHLFGLYLEFYFAALITGILGLWVIYEIRRMKAKSLGFSTQFVIWPIGVAITIITAILRFLFLAFGFFQNTNANSNRDEAIVGIYTVVSSLALGLLLALFSVNSGAFLNYDLRYGIYAVSQFFALIAILFMLPFGVLDGKKIYDWDQRNFWIILISVVVVYIVSIYTIGL